MNVSGIVVEYNPLHNGHVYHIEKTKEITNSDYIVAIMSGDFVQRGQPAIVDKYNRTLMALNSGVDLVIELPIYYAMSSAEFFSYGAIYILEKSGIVNNLCFGSESNNIEDLKKLAYTLYDEPYEYKLLLNEELKKGYSFPRARNIALSIYLKQNNIILENIDTILNSPNNILGIEYIKALLKLNSSITPTNIQRISSDYHSKKLEGKYSSATAIREAIYSNKTITIKEAVPNYVYDILTQNKYTNINDFSSLFHYKLLNSNSNYLSNIFECNEGIQNRIIKYSKEHFYISDIIAAVKTKRYTYTKIQRIIMNILLDIKKEDIEKNKAYTGPQYIRILGFRNESRDLLKELKKKSQLPIISSVKNYKKILYKNSYYMLEKDILATNLYEINKGEKYSINKDFTQAVIII